MSTQPLVLVTGGTGFISARTVEAFLENGFRVRTTCRDPDNAKKTAGLRRLKEGLDDPSRLEIVKAADLLDPECWKPAAKGCDLCAHLASPFFFAKNKKEEAEMCNAAENGTLNVLRACEEAGIKRVVVTSSVAAVIYGHEGLHGTTIEEPEKMWSVRDKIDGYVLSKMLAEQAAWKYVKEESKIGMQLSTVNPVWVVGPPLAGNSATSHEVLTQMFTKKMPAIPDAVMPTVDVRDVALAHVRALQRDEAIGQRFVAVADSTHLRPLADELVKEFGPLGYSFKTGKLPKWILSVASVFSKNYKAILHNVGVEPITFNTSQSEKLLGLKYRPCAYKAHIEQAHALIQHGALPITEEYKAYLKAQAGGDGGGGGGGAKAEPTAETTSTEGGEAAASAPAATEEAGGEAEAEPAAEESAE